MTSFLRRLLSSIQQQMSAAQAEYVSLGESKRDGGGRPQKPPQLPIEEEEGDEEDDEDDDVADEEAEKKKRADAEPDSLEKRLGQNRPYFFFLPLVFFIDVGASIFLLEVMLLHFFLFFFKWLVVVAV